MTDQDDQTRTAARAASDQLDTFLHHFTSSPDATWGNFGKDDYYLEVMRLHILEILLCTERELQLRAAVEPTDLGS